MHWPEEGDTRGQGHSGHDSTTQDPQTRGYSRIQLQWHGSGHLLCAETF